MNLTFRMQGHGVPSVEKVMKRNNGKTDFLTVTAIPAKTAVNHAARRGNPDVTQSANPPWGRHSYNGTKGAKGAPA